MGVALLHFPQVVYVTVCIKIPTFIENTDSQLGKLASLSCKKKGD